MATNPLPVPNGPSNTFSVIHSNFSGNIADNLNSNVCITNNQQVTETDESHEDAPILFNTLTINSLASSQPFLQRIQNFNMIKLVGYSPEVPDGGITTNFWFLNAPGLTAATSPLTDRRIMRVPNNHLFAERPYIILKATLEDGRTRPSWVTHDPQPPFTTTSIVDPNGVEANNSTTNPPTAQDGVLPITIFDATTSEKIVSPGGSTVQGGIDNTNNGIFSFGNIPNNTGIYGGRNPGAGGATLGGGVQVTAGHRFVFIINPGSTISAGSLKFTIWMYKQPTLQVLGEI